MHICFQIMTTQLRTSLRSISVPITTPTSQLIYRARQKQLDDLNLAPCRHLCRWRGEIHIAGQSVLKPSAIMQRQSEEHRAFSVETFFKNNDSATATQRVFRRHFDIGRNGKVPTRQTILNWVTQFGTTASIVKQKPPRRPRTVRTPENARRLAHAFQRSPQLSVRRHSIALHLIPDQPRGLVVRVSDY